MSLTEEARQALLRLQRERQNAFNDPSGTLNAFQINQPLKEEKELSRRELFDRRQEQFRSLREQASKPIVQPEPDENLGALRNLGKTLYEAGAAGTYELAESAGFGAPGLIEAGLERFTGIDLGIQETAREFQEENTLAKIAGGVGTGAGYLVGAPVKFTSRALGGIATTIGSRVFGKQTTKSAIKSMTQAAKKAGKLSEKVQKELSDEVGNVLNQTVSSVGIKTGYASKAFEGSFKTNINTRIRSLLNSGQINSRQADAMRKMAQTVAGKGVPVKTLQQLATQKFGEGAKGRFMGEFLEDALVFSVADGVMSITQQGQQVLRGDKDSISYFGSINPFDEKFLEVGSVAREVVFGFAGGTVINAFGVAPFKPLNKLMKSKVDFYQGVRAALGRNNYKGKSLDKLVEQATNLAEQNKFNSKSTRMNFTKDGEKSNIDLFKFGRSNERLTNKKLVERLREELGDDAEKELTKWLMSNKKQYAKDIINESIKEGFENYRLLFPRMGISGLAMSGVQYTQNYIDSDGQYQIDPTDFVSSFLIGGFTMRRGNFGKIDIDTKINKLREGLDALGIKSSNTFHSSNLSGNNERFGVGVIRDNPELTKYLEEEGIVSNDRDVTNDAMAEGEKSFYDNENIARRIDPYGGRINVLKGLMDADYTYVKTLDQITDKQASKIISLLDSQGFKTVEDMDKALQDRVNEATQGMEEKLIGVLRRVNQANHPDIRITENNSGIRIPANMTISNDLLERANKGEFKEWLNGKDGIEAEEELYSATRSLETVTAVTEGLSMVSFDKSQSSNKIVEAATLKSIYDIVKNEENNIDNQISNKDGRASFKFTELDSYIVPMMRNMGKNVTKNMMNALSEENMDARLQSSFIDAGLIVMKDNKPLLVNDYSSIKMDDDASKIDLGKIHGILKALGQFDVTTDPSPNIIEKTQVSRLKESLGRLGVKLDLINRPNMDFMYQMILNDINKIRLKNNIVDQSDIDFIIKQSGKSAFSIPGVLDNKGIRNFQLREVSIPSDLELQNRYNKKLKDLKRDTDVVNVVANPVQLKPEDARILRQEFETIYNTDRSRDDAELDKLFDLMENTKLSGTKNQIIEYIKDRDYQAKIDVLNMLHRQKIIKRNVDGNLEIINKNLTIENFESISKDIERLGYTSDIVENRIKQRQEDNRSYNKEAIDVIKNPSLGIDQFFSRYKFKQGNQIVSYNDQSNESKKEYFDSLLYEKNPDALKGKSVQENFVITEESIKKMAESVVFNNTEFSKIESKKTKDKIFQDISQIAFGSKDRVSIPKFSIRNNSLSTDENREIMQNNPVHTYFRSLGLDYAIFDNTVTYTEFNPQGNLVEKSYNILATENIPTNLRQTIRTTAERVAQTLRSKNFGQEDAPNFDPNNVGIKKLDVFDGMDSIAISTNDVQKIVDDFNRFYKEHVNKVTGSTKEAMKLLKQYFDSKDSIYKYDEEQIEHATRFLIYEVGFKSKDNELFYKILNEDNAENVDKYIKRLKLITTKNFVRPTEEYLESIKKARSVLMGKKDKVVDLINKRLTKKGHNVVIWDDDTESMSQIIQDLKAEYPEYADVRIEDSIGKAHSEVSGFDSISYLSKEAMNEYHAYMGHSPDSTNPIKPVISSQGEGKTLLYGKTLFVYSPALDGFFKNNPTVDILLTKSGAKAFDGAGDPTKREVNMITNTRWDELNTGQYSSLIKTIDINALGLRPQKDSDLLSASISDADFNYMNVKEHAEAFKDVEGELGANLEEMSKILNDPIRLNSFMRQKMQEGNIPEDSQEGSLKNLSNLMYYMSMKETADPRDYSLNQAYKYLAQEYIDTIFSKRRAFTNRIKSKIDSKSGRYGGQAELIVSGKSHVGKKKTRLLPTIINKNGNIDIRGQLMLPHAERNTLISGLGTKKIRIVQNDKILKIDDFFKEVDDVIGLSDNEKNIIEQFKENLETEMTLGGAHDMIQTIAELTNTRYEIGVISRRNPRTRPNDITLLGLRGFLDESQGLGVEINSFDIANVYEGDYDADKVDYFFAHDDYMFDHINRSQAYFVQGIDPSDSQGRSNFTFGMDSRQSRNSVLSKIGSSISYKQAIGIVQKTPRKVNYIQNLGNKDYMFDSDQADQWEDELRTNEFTKEKIGPSLLYQSGENEYVTVDTETLAYFQRAAFETQLFLDGSGSLNKDIASDIYNWLDKFLFPKNENSLKPKEVTRKQLREIIENGQTVNGKRVRIFNKYTLDKDTNKYKTTKTLNDADKLIIKEFLNQHNKLLNSFGDKSYQDGSPRKSTFYDLYNGSVAYRDFHKNIYKGLFGKLLYKKNTLNNKDKNYLNNLLKEESGSFEIIKDNVQDIYDGQGGGFLDRMAVQIAKSDFMEGKKEMNLNVETMNQVDTWFSSILDVPLNAEGDFNAIPNTESDIFIEEVTLEIDKFSKKVVDDTQKFNSYISTIKRLDKKKEFINKSSYGWKWKKNKINALDYVINKFQNKVEKDFQKQIKNLDPKKLNYKKYIPIENSNLVRSVIHKNSLNTLLKEKSQGYKYDSFTETLSDDAREDLQIIKDFNSKVYGGNTLIDDIIPNGKSTIIKNKKMFDFIQKHKIDISNVWELRQRYLVRKIEEHGLNFLYAYMEPIRNRDAIGVFNNRPIAIPYKESARYTHGIQLMVALARGDKKVLADMPEEADVQSSFYFDNQLREILDLNEHYRRFFEKDVDLFDTTNPLIDRAKLMKMDANMEKRLKSNDDFSWSSQMLASDPLALLNKSTIEVYQNFAEAYTDKSREDYKKFIEDLNDLDLYAAKHDYINPMRYAQKKLELDELFTKLSKEELNTVDEKGNVRSELDNPIYADNKFFKFKPKQVKSDEKLISMMKNIRELSDELNRTKNQRPVSDKGADTIRDLKEIRDCQ